MTVTTGVARERFIGTGTTGPFSFNYRLYDDEHLTIVKTDTSAVDTALALTTDYTVSIASDFSSATITLVSSLAGDGVDDGGSEVITVTRDPPVQQLVSWPRNDPFPSSTHERAADLAVMMIGRLDEKIGRSILLPESSALTGLQIPDPLADYAIGWNADATNLANVGVPTVYVQDAAPTGTIILNSLWIDSDSTNLDLYQYNGSAWVDTTTDLRGATGATGATGSAGADGSDGADGTDGLFSGTETQVTARSGDLVPHQDASDSSAAKRSTAQSVAETARVEIELLAFDAQTDVVVGNVAGGVFFRVPAWMNGYVITDVVAAHNILAGGTGTTTVQIVNDTQSADVLSTELTIDVGDFDSSTATTPAVIDTSEDVLTTGDQIVIDVDAVPSGGAPLGLLVSITAERPTS